MKYTTARTAIFALLVISGSIVLGLVVGESGLQVVYRIKKGEWLWENSAFRIGYTRSVNDRRQYNLRPGYQDEKIGLSIDQNGFRNPVPRKTTEKLIVVCLGDSVPFGAGVRDEETYPSYLAANFESAGGHIGVLNGGVPSYNLRQSFDRLRKDVFSHYDSDRLLLITVEAANDISLLTYYGSNWSPDLTWADVRWSGTWGQPAFKKLASFYYLSKFFDLSRFNELHYSVYVQAAPNYETKRKEMYQNINNILHTELTALQELSIPVILVPVNPFYYQLYGRENNEALRNWKQWKPFVEEWYDLINGYNNLLLAVSKEFPNAYFFDMRRVMDSYDRNELYLDYMHYTPKGNKLLADELSRFVVDHGLIRRKTMTVTTPSNG